MTGIIKSKEINKCVGEHGGILMNIDAEIEIVRNKIITAKSHLARIELEKRLQELKELKIKQGQKESWEM